MNDFAHDTACGEAGRHEAGSREAESRGAGKRARKKLRRLALECNLTQHCNLRCAGCDHASPHLPKSFTDFKTFSRDLRAVHAVLHVSELKILGGEPLLHPELESFLREVKAIGIADSTTLVTNGLLLQRMDPRIFELIDKLWISIYPSARLRFDRGKLERLAAAHDVRLDFKRVDRFRRTLLDEPHQDAGLTQELFSTCGLAHRWSCHTIHEGRYYKCAPALFLEPRMAQQGRTVDNRLDDSLALHDDPDLLGSLRRYLEETTPLLACRYCLGSNGDEAEHRQLSEQELRSGRNDLSDAPVQWSKKSALRKRMQRSAQARWTRIRQQIRQCLDPFRQRP